MTVEASVREFSELPNDRVNVAKGRTLSVENLDFDVLFLLAPWSGPSLVALRNLTRQLASFQSVRLTVVDSDELSDEALAVLGITPHGYGETFWVVRGKVIASLLRYQGDWKHRVDNATRLMHRH